MKRILIPCLTILVAVACSRDLSLPRGKASAQMDKAFSEYLQAVQDADMGIHSIMVLQHGKVLEEKWMGEGHPDSAHVMFSVSKTFTSTAVGFAIEEGLLHLDDKMVDFFPDLVPENASDTLRRVTVRHLLTMNCGHAKEPSRSMRESNDWIRKFLEWPVAFEPGTCFCYNSVGTYMLSAIVQKVTGQKIVDYLEPRLWKPLGIEKPLWQESPEGINCGGWGLFLKTEDMAKMGQCLLDGGRYAGRQVIPATWVEQMSSYQVPSCAAGRNQVETAALGLDPAQSDWLQGYGYQMWRCRHNAFRADGAWGQYIIVIPEADAVVVTTAHAQDMQQEINQIWTHLLPALQQ